ncbi:MAG: DNA polymerase IV, partial [Planctomycetes bacterium]|nr:DNA polymerase IV [Planctomycetota bacterium]
TLLAQADKVAPRMRKHDLIGKVVFIKLRYGDFTTLTRRVTLPSPTNLAGVINKHGAKLLWERTEAGARPVRLIGVGMAGLSAAGEAQGNLFATPSRDDKLERLERTADTIRDKLGKAAIQRASVKFGK